MYLKSLELSGFKSFAKKTALTFESSITGIVGPNGSGKSNVAEAFRFVLGEQSMKSMRSKRGEDLIFNGSRAVPKANRAGVKLVFDNHKRLFTIDFDEVSIERVVHRDSVNEYLINGSSVRHRDILELLASANIGASGHHIISQGEADRMLNASIKERKAMIEDALGLKVYQYKKIESERKLEKTAENIKQVESLRREIAPHLRYLEKQVEKQRRAEELRRELVNRYQEYLKREEVYLEHTRRRLAEEKEKPSRELAGVDEKIQQVKVTIAKAEGSDSRSKELLEIETELRALNEELEGAVREVGRLDGAIFAEQRGLERARATQGSPGVQVPLLEVEKIAREAEELLVRVNHEGEVGALRSLFQQFVSNLRSFVSMKRGVTSRDNDLSDLERELRELKEKKETAEKERIILSQKIKEARGRYEKLKHSIEKDREAERGAERELFSLMTRRGELTGLLASLSAQENEFRREDEGFKAELLEAQTLGGSPAVHFSHIDLFDKVGKKLSPVEVAVEPRDLQRERLKSLEKLKIRLEEIGVGVGEEALKEYEETKNRDAFLEKEVGDLERSAESLQVLITELAEKLSTEFSAGVEKINREFNTYFTLMFGGGSASLSVVSRPLRRRALLDVDEASDMEDEEGAEEGIDITVSLPNKRTKGLEMLSGGERALTSIALLFAISQVNPPPFIILDETDAALDEANSKKYGDMVENLSEHSQLILITHNRETMSRSGILYGVTMGADGVSRLLSVKFDEAVAVAK